MDIRNELKNTIIDKSVTAAIVLVFILGPAGLMAIQIGEDLDVFAIFSDATCSAVKAMFLFWTVDTALTMMRQNRAKRT